MKDEYPVYSEYSATIRFRLRSWLRGVWGENLERKKENDQYFRISKLRIIYSTVLFSNLFFYFLAIIWTPKILNNFSNCKILNFKMIKIFNFWNLKKKFILQIEQFRIFNHFSNQSIIAISKWLVFWIT